MLKKLFIKNFKCFSEEIFELNNLTVLTGENSSGKSSLIQAILFLGNPPIFNQSFNSDLSSYLQSLGRKELFNKLTNAKEIYLKAEFLDNISPIEIKIKKSEFEIKNKKFKYPNLLTYSKNLFYLNADRGRIKQLNQYFEHTPNNYLGIKGELIANYYEHNKHNKLIDELIKDETSYTLENQTNYWIKNISGIDEIEIISEKLTSTYIKTYFKYNELELFPENVGTGLSYLFYIIVTCLSLKKDNIVIIENPEIHLHPKSQAKLGEFFVFIAKAGIQVIIETHNDHIINKIRYEVYKNKIDSKNIIFYYFQKNEPKINKLYLNNTGHWIDENNEFIQFPIGFFDATLDELLEMG